MTNEELVAYLEEVKKKLEEAKLEEGNQTFQKFIVDQLFFWIHKHDKKETTTKNKKA